MPEVNDASPKKNYEIGFLVKRAEAGVDVAKLLRQHEAEIVVSGPTRTVSLAYKIDHETEAVFGFFEVRLNPGVVPALTHDLETHPAILRFLCVRVPEKVAMQEEAAKVRTRPSPYPSREVKPALPLSNEALEKKIEEILQ